MYKVKNQICAITSSIFLVVFSNLFVIGQSKPITMNYLVTSTSVGDIKLGMTIGEARKVLPSGFTLGPGGGSEGVAFVGVFDGKKHLMDIGHYEDSKGAEKLPPINNSQKIEGITIIDSRFKTAEGVHVGMLIATAEKKYGKLKEMFNYPHEGEFGSFTNQPEYLRFYFRPKGDFSDAGIYEVVPNCPEDAYPPSCSVAKKYNPNSYIFEMSLNSPQPILQITSITDTPKAYKVNIYGPSECVEDVGETTYNISWKIPLKDGGYRLPSQRFYFEGLKPCPELGYGTDKSSVSYKDQWDVFLDDFNFDGMTDLALRDGMNGGYGFPSYQVYLFSKEKNEFILSPSFTELGQYQGMFEVKADRKMIYNHTKSGCCSHTTEGYKIVNNKPFKVYEFTDTYSPDGEPFVTAKRLINGKWQTWDRKSAEQFSFDKGKTSKTSSVKLSDKEPIKWFKFSANKGQILTVKTNSADADVEIVDGDARNINNNVILEQLEGQKDLIARLKGTGNYYLQISAEQNVTIDLTISIEKDDGTIIFPSYETESNTSIDEKKEEEGVVIIDLNNQWLLGGFKNGKFVDPKTAFANFKVGENYKVFDNFSGNDQKLFKTPKIEIDDRLGNYYFEQNIEKLSGIALSPNVSWNPMPRKPVAIDVNNKAYQKVVREFLQSNGISKPDVKIRQLLKVDLEGDGQDEVFIYANNDETRSMSPSAGTYSFMILRKIINGKVKNIIIESEIHKTAKQIQMWSNQQYKITSIIDLDGDGIMEFIVYTSGYESEGTIIYKLENGEAKRLLEVFDGA